MDRLYTKGTLYRFYGKLGLNYFFARVKTYIFANQKIRIT